MNDMMQSILQESLRRTDARIRREIFLGTHNNAGQRQYVSPEQYLASHWHLVGSSNFGKSYFTEHLLRELTAVHIPASMFDPHGDHAEHYYDFLQQNFRLRRANNVMYLKAGSAANGVGFNPFNCGLEHPAEIASLVLEAFMKVWGADTFNQTPRLERILRNMFYLFAANKMPLTEAYRFLLVNNRSFREQLSALAPDERVRLNWQEIERLPQDEKLQRFESSWNRLQRFLEIPAIERLFAEQPHTINFTQILNRGQILVANLGLLRSTEAQSIAGTMLVNAMFHAAKRRPEGRRRHWFLAIDEFPQFVTSDIARSLDQLRKFGVRLILAHQHLEQIPLQLLASVMTNAKMRMVFGGLWRPDAEILVRELFPGVSRGDRIKHINLQTKFRPRLEEREIISETESTTDGQSESEGWSSGHSSTEGYTAGNSISKRAGDDGLDEIETDTYSSNVGSSNSHGESQARTRNRSQTSGTSRSNTFVTVHEEFKEEGSRQYWSLDEQWEELIAHLMNLDRRQALAKVLNKPVVQIETPEIKHRILPRRTKRLQPSQPQAKLIPHNSALAEVIGEPSDDLPADFHE